MQVQGSGLSQFFFHRFSQAELACTLKVLYQCHNRPEHKIKKKIWKDLIKWRKEIAVWLILRNSTIIFPCASWINQKRGYDLITAINSTKIMLVKTWRDKLYACIHYFDTGHSITRSVMACNTEWHCGSSTGIGASFFIRSWSDKPGVSTVQKPLQTKKTNEGCMKKTYSSSNHIAYHSHGN